MEIERQFLIKKLPNIENYPKVDICQGYISLSPEIRIRKKGEECFLTRKSNGTLVREEKEIVIPYLAYEMLLPLVKGLLIEKTRYQIPLEDNLVAELDIYHKDFKGFITVEVEFPSIEVATKFQIPDWFGLEVTKDIRYKNKNMAMMSDVNINYLIMKSEESQKVKKYI